MCSFLSGCPKGLYFTVIKQVMCLAVMARNKQFTHRKPSGPLALILIHDENVAAGLALNRVIPLSFLGLLDLGNVLSHDRLSPV